MRGASLLADRRGSHLVEKCALIALIALAVLLGFRGLGLQTSDKVVEQGDCVASLEACAAGQGRESGAAMVPGHSGEGAPGESSAALTEGERPGKAWWRRPVDLVAGFFKQGWTMFPETWEIIKHPFETGKNLWYVVRHPIDTYYGAKEGLGQAWNENPEELSGRILWEVVSLPFIASKISKLRLVAESQKLVRASKLAKGVVWANGVRRVAEIGCRTSHAAEAGELGQEGKEVEPHDHAAGTDINDPGTPSKRDP